MFTEDDLLPLSALQHLVFCERQAALIHIERVWQDNPATVEGKALHEKVEDGVGESRGDLRIARDLPLTSLELGLAGKSDVVELHRAGDGDPAAVAVPGLPGRWRLYPVEYKRGKPKPHQADEVQLCAQALCLEENLGGQIPEGALFYHQARRRQTVALGEALRQTTRAAVARLHALFAAGTTPLPVYEAKCHGCSLFEICQPQAPQRSAATYLESQRRSAARDEEAAP
ncbi:MAG TPA: CRISPR-associated protein Cas4 [Thermoanaerobaculia bacterium]|nr:CRISPR-associated protein Cas4 [Thermoanaerobaculia bacterium]